MVTALSIVLLNTGIKVFLTGAGVGLIGFIFYSIMNAGLNKVNNALNPAKDVSQMRDPDEVLHLARVCLHEGRMEEAKIGFKRVIELDPDCWYAWSMLGNMLFAEDKEMSFKGLKILENQILMEGKKLDDESLSGHAINYYMLGYHYHHNNETAKGATLKSIAMNNRSFIKNYKNFRQKYPY